MFIFGKLKIDAIFIMAEITVMISKVIINNDAV